MDRFWKWLMKMDARGIFIISLVALFGVIAWRAMEVVELQREDEAKAEEEARNQDVKPKLNPYSPIGVIGFVSNQFASETLVVPINPFHPAFEEMARHVMVIGGSNVVVVTTRSGQQYIVPADVSGLGPAAAAGQGAQAGAQPVAQHGAQAGAGQNGLQGGRPWGQQQGGRKPDGKGNGGLKGFVPPKKNIPYVVFSGFFERPDGNLAPYVRSTVGGGKFLVKGDFYNGAVVTAAGKDGVEFEFSNGKKISVVPGGEPQAFTPETDDKAEVKQ